ncbi:unnamed protein product [Dracunculus medinensis]|uniref:8.9 kDa family member n=1 Tax=Dracunculus medinensis TaxID=318479 RepID=A0A0N4UM37_DRAME|nr:unnamed protein product [Dracunculus medinensis]
MTVWLTCFKGKFCNISANSVYVPNLCADDSDKDKCMCRSCCRYDEFGNGAVKRVSDNSYGGAETGNCHGSEHVMVRAKIRIKLTNRKKQRIQRSFNDLKLKDSGM